MRFQIDTFPIKDGKTSSIVSNQLCLETLGFHNFHHDEVFGKIYIFAGHIYKCFPLALSKSLIYSFNSCKYCHYSNALLF